MNPRLVFLLFCGVIIPELGNTQLFLRARRTSDLTIPYCPPGYYWTPDGLIEARAPLLKREPLRVLINATGDTIVMKFLRPSPSTKLEGYILGYGSSFYSKQYIPFPENGKPFVTEIEAEPKYLISVQPVQPVHPLLTLRKYCAASQITRQKPLHLVVGTLTPTSVLLSWGILIKSQKSGILMNDCLEDRMYTVRYKENEKKNWLFQSCPTTETVIDKLKPDTIYEFGVKDKDDRTWSNRVIHKLETYSEKGNTKIRKPSLPEKQIPVYVDRKENKVIFKKSQPGWNETHKLPSYPKTTQPPTVTETKSVPTRVLKGSFKPSASATTFHEKPQPTLGNGVYAEHQQEIFTSIKSDLPGLSNTNQASTEPQPETSATELHDIPDLPENLLATTETDLGSPVPTDYDRLSLQEIKMASSEPEMEHPESRSHDRSTLSANPQATPEVKLESPLDKIYTTRNLPEAPQVTVEPEKEASVSTPYDRSELPENQEATNEPESETVLYKSYIIPALPKTHEATNEPESETILSKSYIIPGLSKTHEATDEPDLKTPVHKSHDTSALPTSQHAAKELELEIPVHKTPETSLSPELMHVHKETQQESEKSASSDKDGVAQGLPALKEATQEPAKLLTPFSEHQRAIIAPNGTPQSDIPNESKTTYTFVLPEEILALTETPQQNDNHTTSAKDDVANSLPDPHGTPPSEITIKPLPPYALVMPEEIQAPTETKQESDKSTVSTEEDMISTLPALNESFQEPVRPQTSLPEKPSPVIAANETLPEYYKSVASSLPEGSGTTKAYFETSSPKANDTQEMLQTNLVQSNKDQGSSKPRKPVSDPGVTALGYDQQLQAPQKPKSPDTSVIPITSLASSEKLEERPIIAATEKHQDVAAAPKKIRQKTENNKPSRRPELVKSVTGSVISANQASIHPSTARNRATRPPFPRHPFISRGTPKQTQPPKPNANTRKPLPPNQIPGKPGIKETTLRPIQSSSTVRSPSKPVVNPTKGKVKEQGTETTAPSADITSTDPPAIFSSTPTSLTDMMGESRYIAPHVVFMPKNETDPCSITDTVKYFPDTEASHQNISTPPQQPPSNLTVITVEGCPSFVILNWTEANNDTATEYIVKSMVNGTAPGKGISIQVTNQTHSAVENLMPNTSYVFQVTPSNILGQGPPSNQVEFNTESADPRVSEYISVGKDAIWTEIRFKSDTYSECHGKQFVKRTWYKKFVGVQLCNSLRYKIYLGDSLGGTFYNIGDQSGFGEDHCQFVDSFLDGKTGRQLHPDQLPNKQGYYRSVRQEPVHFGEIGGNTHASYVHWYECGTTIPGKW
ncbi:target of Nesh-SH3 isoform X43 [Protopterus annectens]|uniref:target of Nesh-SH3 isoform X43 n=1 Tax=Protopterus annectens TaxID=7888 RepID=UPI001CFC2DEA|nr:target of Nesh-SH3 isoform X43 [Protopterus annectens]